MGFDKKRRIYSKKILQFLYSSTALLSIFFVKVGEMTLGSDASFSFSPPPAVLQQNYSMGWEEEEEELEPHPHLPHH